EDPSQEDRDPNERTASGDQGGAREIAMSQRRLDGVVPCCGSVAEHPMVAGAAEYALRVEGVAQLEEAVEVGVERSQFSGVVVELFAPVRPGAEWPHHLPEAREVIAAVWAVGAVGADLAAVCALRWAHPHVVAADEADLEGEVRRRPAVV